MGKELVRVVSVLSMRFQVYEWTPNKLDAVAVRFAGFRRGR